MTIQRKVKLLKLKHQQQKMSPLLSREFVFRQMDRLRETRITDNRSINHKKNA